MSSEIEDYTILDNCIITKLVKEVLDLLADGWVLYGQPYISGNEHCQAMVKFKKYEEPQQQPYDQMITRKFEPGLPSNPKADVAGIVEETIKQKFWDDVHKRQFEDIPRQSFGGVDGKPKD